MIFTGKQLWWSLCLNKAADLQGCNFIKKEIPQHRCFSVSIAKCLRTHLDYFWIFEKCFLKPGSHHGNKLDHQSSLPEINVVEIIKGSTSNLHRQWWVGQWISKSFDIHHPGSSSNHVSFLLCQKMSKD